jgi:hypothetical protein
MATGTGVPVETHISNLFLDGQADSNGNIFGGYLTVLSDEIQGGPAYLGGNTFQNSTNLGAAGTSQQGVRTTTGVVSDGATAKTVLNVVVPNIANSFTALLLLRVGITTTGHIYDSTRAGLFLLAVTRVPGAATVATLTSVSNATIATSAAGQTVTYTLATAAVTGANTATQTLPIQITATGSVTGTADCEVVVLGANGAGTAANVNLAAPTGVTVS